jgi:two-component system sensor kinase FixL
MTSLKSKILFGIPAILIGVMVVAAGAVLVIIQGQSRAAAHHLLQNAFNIARYTLSERQQELLSDTHRAAAQDDLGGKLKYVTDSGPYFKYSILRPTYIALCSQLYQMGASADVWKAALYDTRGDLVCSAVREEGASVLGYAGNQNTSEGACLRQGEKLTADSWSVRKAPGIGLGAEPVPNQESVAFDVLEGSLCLVARVPILGRDYDPKTETIQPTQVGTLVAVQKLGEEFVRRTAYLAGTDINLFGANGLIAGTHPEYVWFSLASLAEAPGSRSLAAQPATYDDLVVDRHSHFRGVLPIYAGSRCVAAIVALCSQEAAKAGTRQIIKLLSLVYLVSIALIVPLVMLVVARGILHPIRKTAAMMRQIAVQKDFDRTLAIDRADEIGELAAAFNTMTEDLRKTTTSIHALNQEIAERKKAEEGLSRLLSLHGATLEATADGILVVGRDGRVLSHNRRFLQLWRIPEEVAASQDDARLLACVLDQLVDPEGFLAEVRRLYACPEESSFDLLRFKDGRAFERFSQPQKIGDQAVGRVWSFRDVTDRANAEARQADLLRQLERTNQELKDFAHVVSHDLKAPLRGVKSLVDWIVTDYADRLDQDGKEQMRLLVSRVDRMHNLIDGILQYSRIGRTEEERVDVDLKEKVSGLIDLLAPPHVAVAIEGDLPTVQGEPTRLGQVFQNLLSNAIKYMDKPEGRVSVACVDDGEFWRFSVSDNGPGIPAEHHDRIFKIFQTLTRRDDFESTGIGLTVVKKIVEGAGGRVWLTSTVGEGTTFYFTYPKHPTRCPVGAAAGAGCRASQPIAVDTGFEIVS